jgi:very-short-patch-repair endonuclease
MKREINWAEIQEYHNQGYGYREIVKKFKLNNSLISNAKKDGLLIFRSMSESRKIAAKKYPQKHSEKTKKKISEIRRAYLKEHPEKVPYKLNHYSKGPSYPETYFDEIFKDKFEYEKYFQVGIYHIDFAITTKNIAIEVDGDQHYLDEKIVKSDERKNKYLIDEGWDIIRIKWSDYQKMIKTEKENYIIKLVDYINHLISERPEVEIKNKVNYCKCGKQIYKTSNMCKSCATTKQMRNKPEIKYMKKEHFCITCNENKVYNKGKECVKCAHLKQRKVKNRPSKEELILMIKETSLEAVGRKYGVTGNAVKKWLK